MKRSQFEMTLAGPGYLLDEECEFLSRYAAVCRYNAVEIGVGFGASTTVLVGTLPVDINLISIDPFILDTSGPLHWKASEERCRIGVTRSIQALCPEDAQARLNRWRLIVDYSQNVLPELELDHGLIFVDGDHRYPGVRQDVELSLAHMRRGGVLIMHDSCKPEGLDPNVYMTGWDGPTQVANELRQSKKVTFLDSCNSMVAFMKVKDG